ncbi:MAG: FkbM family methyltransferase [Clostridiales bacterium]|nr:FkbM family methyltransferase [Clostridiales bacterium]
MINLNSQDFKRIYNKMADEESKYIFSNRILYSITEDSKYILNLIDLDKFRKKLKDLSNSGKKIIAFGAGKFGRSIVEYFDDFKWECFVDNYIKTEILNLKVITIEELKEKYLDDIIVITSNVFSKEIYHQLIDNGFAPQNIINFIEEYEKENRYKQYFEFPPEGNEQESFVDAGAYDGETSKKFVEWCNGNYSKIWAFDPDLENYELCMKNLKLNNCYIYNMGVFNKDGILKFNAGLKKSSSISENGDTEIKTVKLDNILKEENVTFIKMDIEGAELAALEGAKNIITEQKPRLAICVYHKPEDIIEIPRLLLEYNPEYNFRLRHYSCSMCETVLYAF